VKTAAGGGSAADRTSSAARIQRVPDGGPAKVSNAAFWRLLAEYERISRDETVAIRSEDFETAATIQALKALLFLTLESSGRDLGIDRRQASFHARLEKIADAERANQTFVKQLLAQNAAERRTLDTARSRLRGLLHSYVSLQVPSGGSFFAQG